MRLTFSIFSLATLLSCTNIYFETPQPKDQPVLTKFPEKYQGTFLLENDTVTISANAYSYPEDFKDEFHISMIDSMTGTRIVGEELFRDDFPKGISIPYSLKNDTVKYDTVLVMSKWLSDSLVIKDFGTYLVMNQKEKEDPHWVVYLLKRKRSGDLSLMFVGNFQSDDEDKRRKKDGMLSDFYGITPFTQIGEDEYLISPSQDEFKKLIRKGFFIESEELKRISD